MPSDDRDAVLVAARVRRRGTVRARGRRRAVVRLRASGCSSRRASSSPASPATIRGSTRAPARRACRWRRRPRRSRRAAADAHLGLLGGAHCFAAEAAADAPPPQGFGWHGLRALFSVLEDAHFALAGRALQLLEWDRTHQFCGRCGTPTVPKTTERSRECPACGLGAYPRVAPAIMALIRRGPTRSCSRAAALPARDVQRACGLRRARARRSSNASSAKCWRRSACRSRTCAISRASPGRFRTR